MTRKYAGGHVKGRAATISTNSRGGKALVVLPAGYVRCPVCQNKAKANADRPGSLRAHRDLHSHPCYNREAEAA